MVQRDSLDESKMKKNLSQLSQGQVIFCPLTVHVPPAPISSFQEAFSH